MILSPTSSSSFSSAEKRKLTGRKLKTTLIVVPNTLLGQWHDELTRFAPNLTLRTLYGSAGKEVTKDNIGHADVLLTTPHTKMPVAADDVVFHRLIIDEAHLFDADEGMAWGNRHSN